jgi:glycosyltransferase involved in cell wall biosynthesis
VKEERYHIGILATHPIQYYVPWYRALATNPRLDTEVFYCYRQTPEGQAQAGFGVPFNWDIPLLEGYRHHFLENRAHIPNVFTFSGCDTPGIREAISGGGFDAFIVHGWYTKSFWQAMTTCWKRSVPLLVRGDSYLLMNRHPAKRWLKYIAYRRFIPRFDAYLVVGERAKEYYVHYGAREEKMFFAPHAVDNDFFSRRHDGLVPKKEEIRKRWNIPAGSRVFLFAGKLIPKKRPRDFLQAIRLASNARRDMWGLVAGDGPLREELEKVAREEKIPVTFTGFLNQNEMPKAYTASDVLVLPSDIGETWGLVVNEAMACGLPAIVSDRVGCAADLVHNGETGASFPCGNVGELSRIITAFAEDPQKLRAMGRRAADLVARYSIATSVNGTIEAVRYVIGKKQRGRHS